MAVLHEGLKTSALICRTQEGRAMRSCTQASLACSDVLCSAHCVKCSVHKCLRSPAERWLACLDTCFLKPLQVQMASGMNCADPARLALHRQLGSNP